MDEKKNNIRLVRSGGRKVTDTKTEYDWDSLEKKMEQSGKAAPSSRAARNQKSAQRSRNSQSNRAENLKKRVSTQKKQKQKRLQMKRRRTLTGILAAAALLIVILFLTPIFNIRTVSVEGNTIVPAEQFTDVLKPLVGQNLLRTGGGKIRRMLREIPYIETADVQKKLFPPSVKITVSEYSPSAILRISGSSLVVTSKLHVVSEDGSSPFSVPGVTGIEVEKYKLGSDAKLSDTEKEKTLVQILTTLEATDIIDKIIEIKMNDLSEIEMNYDNRITVQCGSQLDIERKLRLFKEAVTSNSLAENARGTMDLSEVGKAVYTP